MIIYTHLVTAKHHTIVSVLTPARLRVSLSIACPVLTLHILMLSIPPVTIRSSGLYHAIDRIRPVSTKKQGLCTCISILQLLHVH